MRRPQSRHRVGSLRPSQFLFSNGIGAVVDLPAISAVIMGLDAWDEQQCELIDEPRLLAALQRAFGPQVENLRGLPHAPDEYDPGAGLDTSIGVPVEPFPGWLVCPLCRMLLPVDSGLFEIKANAYRPERTHYEHKNCRFRSHRAAIPVRFMRACANGHLDDLPWIEFVHHEPTECPARLRLDQYGVTGEAALIIVKCLDCGASRSLGEAFGPYADELITVCSGRHPHLRSPHEAECAQPARTIILGASNAWFPASLSVISVPGREGELEQLVERRWRELQAVTTRPVLDAFLTLDSFRQFRPFTADQVWDAIERHRQQLESPAPAPTSLRPPEWEALTAKALPRGIDFKARAIAPMRELDHWLERVVLVDQMRLVQALVGFTRLEAPEDGDSVDADAVEPAPLTKGALRWVPASESKGEGIFLRFREEAIADWLAESAVQEFGQRHLTAHLAELRRRGLRPDQRPFPGMRYILLHSFSHALMRQIALECGYAAASLRERIYALEPTEEDGPMAGVLISTSAPDSEGTLGGVVRLGEQDQLAWHVAAARRAATDCASDPYCAEHEPGPEDASLHGAACHACLFAPETSCERGNRYLDRNVLVQTFADLGAAFFDPAD